MADLEFPSFEPCHRRLGDGHLEPHPGRPGAGRPGPSFRPRRQYLSIRYSERLAENDIVASVGSRGDSYDNALAEAFNSLYKWELIYPQGPWRGLDDVEFATLGYVDWVQPPAPAQGDHRRRQLHDPGRV